MTHIISDTCSGCTACVHICPVGAITGKRKSLHVIDPLLCIDCSACGRICPVDAVLDPNGRIILQVRRSQWLKPSIIEVECISCSVCLQACPVNCLGWGIPNRKSHRAFPILNHPVACIACAFCAQACPVEAIDMLLPASQSKGEV